MASAGSNGSKSDQYNTAKVTQNQGLNAQLNTKLFAQQNQKIQSEAQNATQQKNSGKSSQA